MNFSLKLKELREQRGISQAELAQKLQVGTGSVGMWESTDRIPPAKKLIKIADFFNISTDELLGRTEYNAINKTATAPQLMATTPFATTVTKQLGEISPIEIQLILNFRKLPAQTQDYISGITRNLATNN